MCDQVSQNCNSLIHLCSTNMTTMTA